MMDDERTSPEGPDAGNAPGAQPEENAGREDIPEAAPSESQAAEAPEHGGPATDAPAGDAPAADANEADAAATEEPPAEVARPAEDAAAASEPLTADAPGAPPGQSSQPERPRPRRDEPAADEAPEVVPGADLEPDLVLDEPSTQADPYAEEGAAYAEPASEDDAVAEPSPAVVEAGAGPEEAPEPRTPMELAADARYQATGKRKTSVARVILKPGSGAYIVNGRSLEEFFPRPTLQKTARQPLSTAGYDSRMDVVAKLHGGGVSAQAGALRHGVARALVEADPNLRGELKRRGFLTRDPRVKERKKAGLKKARKRPQFSKR